jgi:hypothetical protein
MDNLNQVLKFIKKGLFVLFVSALVLFGIYVVGLWIKTSNTEKTLRNQIPAQIDKVDLYYTKLVEILVTDAGVTKEYARANTEFQKEIMEGRYGTGEKVMMWIQESNPQFDPSLYKDLMNTIKGLREGFFIEQSKLRDMKLQHDNLIDLFPTSIFVGKRGKIDVQLLVNQETKDARATGIESTPKLFD